MTTNQSESGLRAEHPLWDPALRLPLKPLSESRGIQATCSPCLALQHTIRCFITTRCPQTGSAVCQAGEPCPSRQVEGGSVTVDKSHKLFGTLRHSLIRKQINKTKQEEHSTKFPCIFCRLMYKIRDYMTSDITGKYMIIFYHQN